MNKSRVLIGIVSLIMSTMLISANAADGMISVKSAHNVAVTADRLLQALESKGMKVFARIPHSKGAASVGVTLRETELVIFGNPKVGAPLMNCQQSVAIDLPQKALIWQDATGQVYLSYNDPRHLQSRHSIKGCEKTIEKVAKALGAFAKAATKKESEDNSSY